MDIYWQIQIIQYLLYKDYITRRPDLKEIDFQDAGLINTAVGSKPCVLHVSGETHAKTIALKLGYSVKEIESVNGRVYHIRKSVFYLRNLVINI